MKKLFLLLTAVMLFTASCTKENNEDPLPEEPASLNMKAGSDLVIESINDFGLDIFSLLIDDEGVDTNLFISPVSISLALAMTWNGANTETEDSMAYALRMDHLTNDRINETYSDLIAGLTSCDDKVLLEIANSIWYRQGFSILEDFQNINEQYYHAEVRGLDFSSPDALPAINGWVKDKTHDQIPEIIDDIDPLHVMFLINAIYFKGIWSLGFNKESTEDGHFQLSSGDSKLVSMMSLAEEIGYLENNLFQACELDYGRGNYSMIILLPKTDQDISSVKNNLTSSNWNEWTNSLTNQKVNLQLPKFSFEYEKELNEILALMGMKIAFTGRADFTDINPAGNIYIDYVKHKSFVKVDEEGTEAAAATVVAMRFTAMPDDEKYMFVNRPFLFAIREKTTNTIVFLGTVAEPLE